VARERDDRAVTRLLRLLRSRRVAAAAMAAMAALLLLGAAVSDPDATPERVAALRRTRPVAAFLSDVLAPAAIAESPIFVGLAGLVALSIAGSVVERVARELRRRAPAPAARFRARRVLEAPVPPEVALAAARAVADGARLRIEPTEGPGGVLAASRRTPAFAGSIAFHVGLLVVLVGVAVSARTRASADLVLVEGFPVELGPEPLVHVSRGPAFARLRGTTVSMRDFTAEFAGGFDPVDFACVLDLGRGGRTSAHVVRVNEPLWVDDFEVTLHRYGFAPELRVADARGAELLGGTAVLELLPPGAEDRLPLADGTELRLRLYPDHVVRGGLDGSRSLSPLAPLLVARRERGGAPADRAEVARGATAALAGGRISFPALRYWAELTVARDLGVPWIALGAGLAVLGLAVRFALDPVSLRVSATPRPGGSAVEVLVGAQYFPTLNEERADRLLRRLARRVGAPEGTEGSS
ncbi:MAG TPA: cytochrome c biogenesis protein ResB, partial [Anaeromyxobacteraceae bacterium]|nr:cytochrome c biogenesis protein ResB [Anaeromyxobacteraceae bacterium]